jgi:ATP-dependent HslUV protease subunit HslV
MPRLQRRPFINFTGWLLQSRRVSPGAALAPPSPVAYISVSLVLSKRRMEDSRKTVWHGTTILCVRKGGQVVIAGDGQVSMGQTVVKSNARKLRRLAGGSVIAGFAGATADAITLFERLEGKLEQYASQLSRACVELAKDWRTDRYLRRLEAMMAVADKNVSLILSGTGDVLEPEDGIIGIGSGGGYALAAARALITIEDIDAEEVARRAMAIAAGICVYTNDKITLEKLEY